MKDGPIPILTGMDPTAAVPGRINLKYIPITPEINPVAKSSSSGPMSLSVQSKHNPTHICGATKRNETKRNERRSQESSRVNRVQSNRIESNRTEPSNRHQEKRREETRSRQHDKGNGRMVT